MSTGSCARSLLCFNSGRGFGDSPSQKREADGVKGGKKTKSKRLKGKSAFRQSVTPSPASQAINKTDLEFEQRLSAIKKSAVKKSEKVKVPKEEPEVSMTPAVVVGVSVLLLVALIITSTL